MPPGVEPVRRQLDAHSKALQGEDDAGEFQCEDVGQAPILVGREDVQDGRAKNDAIEHREGRLGEMEAIANQQREESEENQKDGYCEVGDVWSGGFELRPHVG